MAICLSCPCGARVEIPDEDAGEWGSCPRCGVIVYLPPEEEGIRTSIDRPAAPAPQGMLETPVLDLKTRQRRQKVKARRMYLRWVDRALVFHYVTPFLFLAGTGIGLAAVILAMSARTFSWDHAADAGRFFFLVSGVFLFLAGFTAVPASAFGLLGRPPSGGLALLGSLGLFGVGCGSAAALAVLPAYGGTLFIATLLTLFAAWACWLGFLRGLGPALQRPEVAEGAIQTLWGGLKALAVSLPVGLIVGLLVALMLKRPIFLFFVPVAGVGALITIFFHAGGFDSVTGFLLAPTGIPFALEYLGFTSGLRVLIQRRC